MTTGSREIGRVASAYFVQVHAMSARRKIANFARDSNTFAFGGNAALSNRVSLLILKLDPSGTRNSGILVVKARVRPR